MQLVLRELVGFFYWLYKTMSPVSLYPRYPKLTFTWDDESHRVWHMAESWTIKLDGYKPIKISESFSTDLASVPRWLLPLYDPLGKHQLAGIIHDWLYHTKEVSRRTADAIFFEVMLLTGVDYWRAFSMWAAVRMFGGKYWNQEKDNRCEICKGGNL